MGGGREIRPARISEKRKTEGAKRGRDILFRGSELFFVLYFFLYSSRRSAVIDFQDGSGKKRTCEREWGRRNRAGA